MNIDANDLILGRMATVVAKKSLLGERVNIVNCENAVITGKKREIINNFKHRRTRTGPVKGPFIHRRSDMIIKRVIRGMLPYKKSKGREAFQRIKCFVGMPEDIKDLETIEKANVNKMPNLKYIKVGLLVKELGGKV